MSNMVATSHMWLLSTSNIMTSATEKMHLNFLILFQKLIFDIVIRKNVFETTWECKFTFQM